MSNTSRPLMGQTAVRNPDQVVQATSPRDVTGNHQAPNANGNPAEMTPSAPEHDWEKRYKDFQSFHSKEMDKLNKQVGRLKEEAVPAFKVPRTAEELEAFSKESPDLYAVIQSVAHGIAQTQTQAVTSELDSVKNQLGDTRRGNDEDELRRLHPDFLEVDASPEFSSWLETQPQNVKDLIIGNSDNVGNIALAISLFKAQTQWSVQSNQSAQDEAPQQAPDGSEIVNPNASGDPTAVDPLMDPNFVWSEAGIRGMKTDEYQMYSEVIDQAYLDGRIRP